MDKFLIAGLGNPGPEYHDTRHNLGFMVLDTLAGSHDAHFVMDRFVSYSDFTWRGNVFVLIKPNTFVNRSGRAVDYWMKAEKIPPTNLLVIVDELALPYGTIRLKMNGSPAGHNGLKDIDQWLSSQAYARLRIGIGRNFSPGQQADYVLSGFNDEEKETLPAILTKCVEAVISFGLLGGEKTMNGVNT